MYLNQYFQTHKQLSIYFKLIISILMQTFLQLISILWPHIPAFNLCPFPSNEFCSTCFFMKITFNIVNLHQKTQHNQIPTKYSKLKVFAIILKFVMKKYKQKLIRSITSKSCKDYILHYWKLYDRKPRSNAV